MKSSTLRTFALLWTISLTSAFNLRELGNNTLQQKHSMPLTQENEAGLYSRITNGKAAAHNRFYYQVGLRIWVTETGIRDCGGSLISSKWVLTAAHCLHGGTSVDVYLGSIIFMEPRYAFRRLHRDRIIGHEHYNEETYQHDIGLIQIPQISFPSGIDSVTLPPRNTDDYFGSYAYLTGWGRFSDSSQEVSPNLLYAKFRIISNEDCRKEYGKDKIYPGKICTETSNRISGCDEDSGGPLVLKDSKRTQVGIYSFGYGLGCEMGNPDVYTRVSHYLDWIRDHTGLAV